MALPTLLFRLWQPDVPYYLVAAAAGLVGHDWPLYHRFKGGRGLSAIYGALLVIDWPGLFITSLLGLTTGHTLPPERWAADQAMAADVLNFFNINFYT